MHPQRKLWNDRQKALRLTLERLRPGQSAERDSALALFLAQHSAVHSSALSQDAGWSFSDDIWRGLSEGQARRIPRGCEHSIAWLTWHSARIEDVTMNVLLAEGDQLFISQEWADCLFPDLKEPFRDTGNCTPPEEILRLSAEIDIPALSAYRLAVGKRTRQLAASLQAEDYQRRVNPIHLNRLLDEGAVIPAAQELLEYWGGLTLAGLLLMPPTRHNFVHLNEALKIKEKLEPDALDRSRSNL